MRREGADRANEQGGQSMPTNLRLAVDCPRRADGPPVGGGRCGRDDDAEEVQQLKADADER